MLFKTIFVLSCLVFMTNAACNLTKYPEELIGCLSEVTGIIIGLAQKNINKVCKGPAFIANCLHDQLGDCLGQQIGQAILKEIVNISSSCCPERNNTSCYLRDEIIKEQRCFSADSVVTLADRSQKSISQLQSGDVLLAYNHKTKQIVTTSFLTMLDFQPHHFALFKQVTTVSGRQLSLTSSHLLLTDQQSSHGYMMAKNLQSGMNIYVMNEQGILISEKIANVIDIVKQGYMAPLTNEGTLIVNDVAASCYAIIESHDIAHIVLSPMRWWYNMFGQSTEMNSKIGVHWFAKMLYEMTTFLMPSIIHY